MTTYGGATATPGAGRVVKADAAGKISDSWLSANVAVRDGAGRINSVTSPALATDAANKDYVDTASAAGDATEAAARAAADATLTSAIAGEATARASAVTSEAGTRAAADNAFRAIATKTGSYTAVASDRTILFDATSGALLANLPAVATSTGMILTIKKIDASVNTVTLTPATGLIDGAATKVLTTQYEKTTIQCDGSAWWIIG